MANWIRTRGALALIAVSIGWSVSAFVCGLLADAQVSSVLWALCNRTCLALAIGSCALGLGIIVCRSLPLRGSTRCFHCLHCVAGLVCVGLAVWWVIVSTATTYAGLLIVGTTVGAILYLDRRLPFRPGEPTTTFNFGRAPARASYPGAPQHVQAWRAIPSSWASATSSGPGVESSSRSHSAANSA